MLRSWKLLAIAELCRLSDAAWFHGSIEVPRFGVEFLSKFCFDSAPDADTGDHVGLVEAMLHSSYPGEGKMEMVLFDDEDKSFPTYSAEALSAFHCKSSALESASKFTRTINVTFLKDGVSPHSNINQKIRPRWWFVALVDCSGEARTVDYSVHMTNPRKGWLQELSMDRFGPRLIGLFLFAYTVLAICQIFAVMKPSAVMSTAERQHFMRLSLTYVILAALAGMLFLLLNTFYFIRFGLDQSALYMVAKLFRTSSKYSLLCIIHLLAMGRCISMPLHGRDVWKSVRMYLPVCIASFSLEVWGEYSQSRQYTTDNVYITQFGRMLVIMDLVLLVIYLKHTHSSWAAETDRVKRGFYQKWCVTYSAAFLVLPVTTFLSLLLSPWVRAEVLFVVSNSCHTMLLALLVIGLWPEKTQPFFNLDDRGVPQTLGMKAELLQIEGMENELKPFPAMEPKGLN
mmetsp:Transcript_52188/g.93611  ORF Transcript_52188/g.93611 Transcript_52188/m.93611 type:complete len:456 (+) Transcript_52188:64-1431(+)